MFSLNMRCHIAKEFDEFDEFDETGNELLLMLFHYFKASKSYSHSFHYIASDLPNFKTFNMYTIDVSHHPLFLRRL